MKSPDAEDPGDQTAPIDEPDEAPGPTPPEAEADGDQETTVLPAVVDDQPTTTVPAPPRPPSPTQLKRRRKELIDRREEVVYNLGGLAFELHRRARLREPVMRLRAGDVAVIDESVREIDERLAAIDAERQARREERRLRLPARGPKPTPLGHCTQCAAPITEPEARFCWSCGARLERPESSSEAPEIADGDGDGVAPEEER